MGSGASRRNRGGAASAAAAAAQAAQAAQASSKGSAEASGSAPLVRLPPALRRRRRLLLGPQAVASQTQFEAHAPRKQFFVDVPEETVFDRFGSDLDVIDTFRKRAEALQFHGDDGYLQPNALALLDLGIEQDSGLAQLLFEVAQVQMVNTVAKRRPQLTCYELLALYSLLQGGQDVDLLELLFCIFDCDVDDRLSEADLTIAIYSFLQLREASDSFEKEEDREEFERLDEKARHAEAKRLAQQAVKKYGSTDLPDEDEEEEDKGEENKGEDDDDDDDDDDDKKKVTKLSSGKKGGKGFVATQSTGLGEETSTHKRRKPKSLDDDSDSDQSSKGSGGQWSTTPTGKDGPQAKPKRRAGLCRGKPPPDDSDSDSSARFLNPDRPEKPKAKPAPKRKGLCRGAAPADDTSEGEDAPSLPKPKPKPKPKAKRRSRPLCGAGGKRKGPLALNFQQWQKWLAASELLPPGFAGLPVEPSPAAAGQDHGAGIGEDFLDPHPVASKLASRDGKQLYDDGSDSDDDLRPGGGPPRQAPHHMTRPLLAAPF